MQVARADASPAVADLARRLVVAVVLCGGRPAAAAAGPHRLPGLRPLRAAGPVDAPAARLRRAARPALRVWWLSGIVPDFSAVPGKFSRHVLQRAGAPPMHVNEVAGLHA